MLMMLIVVCTISRPVLAEPESAAEEPLEGQGNQVVVNDPPPPPGQPGQVGANTQEEDPANPSDPNTGLCRDQTDCEKAGTSFLISAGLIDLVSLFVGLALWWLMTRRLWLKPGQRFFLSLSVAMSVASTVIGCNPFASPVLLCCLDSTEMMKYVMFSELVPWTRGIVLGAGPVLVVFFLVFVVARLVRR